MMMNRQNSRYDMMMIWCGKYLVMIRFKWFDEIIDELTNEWWMNEYDMVMDNVVVWYDDTK